MVQLLFGLGVDNSSPEWYNNILRTIFALFDTVVYQLLSFIYEILFNIANSTIVSSDTIKVFYGRVQLIIGVFMIFKLAISVLQYVINPDTFLDQKQGMGKVITRIITMLIMFTAIIPLNIPNAVPGSYNAHLNQSGLLFGTLYSLQARILDQGVIQKLVLGYTTPSSEETDASSATKDDSGNAMSNFLLRIFVRINVKDANKPLEESNFVVSEDNLESDYANAYDIYNDTSASAIDLLMNINATDGDNYAFAYFPIVSTICGTIIFVIMCAFCIDVATRSLKLAVLRLIAPIPIISYIDPKSAEKGSFATWVKMLISTFLNLFIILAVVHFVIFLVEQLISLKAISISFSDNIMVNLLTIVFIIIGIFYFGRQAPKFIMDALGVKGLGLGAGLSGLLGATSALIGGAGLQGALTAGITASNNAVDAAITGKEAPSPLSTGSDLAARIRTNDPNAKGGLGQTLQRAAMNRLANINGFGDAVEDKGYFGNESEAARQHINKLNRDIAAEQGNLSTLKSQQDANNLNIQNTSDSLKNNFTEKMRDRINELRRQGYDNASIHREMVSDGYSTEDLGQYFGLENALTVYQNQRTTIQAQINASESTIASYQSELRETEVYKGEMDYNKGKAQEGIDKMYKIYGNVGNASQANDSSYSARNRPNKPF